MAAGHQRRHSALALARGRWPANPTPTDTAGFWNPCDRRHGGATRRDGAAPLATFWPLLRGAISVAADTAVREANARCGCGTRGGWLGQSGERARLTTLSWRWNKI